MRLVTHSPREFEKAPADAAVDVYAGNVVEPGGRMRWYWRSCRPARKSGRSSGFRRIKR